jgi:hypothetical protein
VTYFTSQLGGLHNVGLIGTSLNCFTSARQMHLQARRRRTPRSFLLSAGGTIPFSLSSDGAMHEEDDAVPKLGVASV